MVQSKKTGVVVVTGAASGLGLGCASRFAQDGMAVAMVDINQAQGEQKAAELRANGAKVAFFACDVGIKTQVDQTIAAVIEQMGPITALVCNAGINRPADFVDLSEEDFDLVIRTNLKSIFLFGQAVARHMIAQGTQGAIVNMSSTSVCLTMPNIAAYAASKGGISSLTVAMSLSLAPHGIRVNAMAPGTILTELTRTRFWENASQRQMILSRTPLGRFGEPADVAGLAAFLIGPDSRYITGQTIFIDGGRRGLNYLVPVRE